jgi:formate dehydrogenase maturation protein FdhE
MTRLTILASALAIGGFVSVTHLTTTPLLAWADPVAVQQQDRQEHHPTAAEQAEMQKQEAQTMQMHQKMMADMKAMDEKLNALVTKMNAASGEAKVNAIAEVVTASVQQRAAMRDTMMQMHGQMMGHMMQQMAGGMSPEMKKMMADSPMMKKMMSGGAGK